MQEERDFHPLADIFPLMQGQDFADLVADIRANGLHEPVWLYEGRVLDGRNRWRACREAGVEPRCREYEGDDPVGFVVSLNLNRRHLNESQRAMVGAKVANIERGQVGKNHGKSDGQICLPEAAEKLNISSRSIRSARHVQKDGTPELISKVEAGEVKVSVASDIATLPIDEQQDIVARGEQEILEAAKAIRGKREARRQKQRLDELSRMADPNPALETGQRFPVIYADPPWQYERPVSHSRKIENQYPVMTLEAIQSLPVMEIATDSAILFMWATSPKLEESLSVMGCWGFTYRSCAVWDKQVMGMGYWFRQQTELLLVGIRGQMPAPSPSSRAPSLISEKRQKHSQKPDRVYVIIEAMYPDLPKIELFCRQPRPGWVSFGNQCSGL